MHTALHSPMKIRVLFLSSVCVFLSVFFLSFFGCCCQFKNRTRTHAESINRGVVVVVAVVFRTLVITSVSAILWLAFS